MLYLTKGHFRVLTNPSTLAVPCLSARDVLAVAKVARQIHLYFRSCHQMPDVDVEFVVDNAGTVHIVQARAETIRSLNRTGQSLVLTTTMVDEDKVSSDVKIIPISGACFVAQPGAVCGRLQITDAPSAVRADTILLTNHTNNDWNGVFSSLRAVITLAGGATSHAAKNSRALGIPCLTQVDASVIETLRSYDGAMVTIDVEARKIYVGSVPIQQVRRDLSVWVADPAANEEEPHELFRRYAENHAMRPEVFVADREGTWRRRSHDILPFQIDYYYKAWDRLTDELMARFSPRQSWPPVTQRREIKRVPQPPCQAALGFPGSGLLVLITDGDTRTMFHFLAGMKGVGFADFYSLWEHRWETLRAFDAFLAEINHIDASNIAALIDNLLGVYAQMHFAYSLNVCIDELLVKPQACYVHRDLLELLRDVAVEDEPADRRVDLSRQRDEALYVLVERIHAEGLVALFTSGCSAAEIAVQAPLLSRTIESWSGTYKLSSEHIQRLSDTDEYLQLISARLLEGSPPKALAIVTRFLSYAADHRGEDLLTDCPQTLRALEISDPDLYLLLRGHARSLASAAGVASDVAHFLPQALEEIATLAGERRHRQAEARRILRDFPNLKAILALSKLETTLREDAHHHVVRFQRRIAAMMLELAAQFPAVFDRPEDIFSISTDELQALFFEPEPRFIRLSRDRWHLIESAEPFLRGTCDGDRLRQFEGLIFEAIAILAAQASASTWDPVRRSYLQEKSRLEERVARLRLVTAT